MVSGSWNLNFKLRPICGILINTTSVSVLIQIFLQLQTDIFTCKWEKLQIRNIATRRNGKNYLYV